MEFTLKIIYYVLMTIVFVISGYLLFANLFGSKSDANQRSRIVMILASGLSLGFLYWAYQLGYQQAQYGLGIGMAISAAVIFGVTMLVGLLTGKIHWQ